MRKFVLLFFTSIACFGVFGQVMTGINTPDPEATLDVNGNVMIRNLPPLPSTEPIDEVVVRDSNDELRYVGIDRLFAPVSYVKGNGGSGFSVLSLSLLSGWQKASFPTIEFDENSDFSMAAQEFTAPVDGIYNIHVFVVINNLITGSNLGVGIFKIDGATSATALMAEESFLSVGVNLGLTTVSVSPPTRATQTLAKLNQGDRIVFGVRVPLANLGIFTNSQAQFNIHQVR